MIVVVILIAVTILSIIIQLTSRRPDKYKQLARSVFYRTQQPGKGAWGLGPWYYGDWDLGERVNREISAGKERYAHSHPRRSSHYRHSKHQKRHL